MKALEFVTEVDAQRRLQLSLPQSAPIGSVRVLVLLPDSEAEVSEPAWMQSIAHEWSAELADPREDIYTLEDGKPIDAAR